MLTRTFGVGGAPNARRGQHRNAIHGAGRQAQLASGAAVGNDGVHQLRRADDRVGRTRLNAKRAADARRFIDAGDDRGRRAVRDAGHGVILPSAKGRSFATLESRPAVLPTSPFAHMPAFDAPSAGASPRARLAAKVLALCGWRPVVIKPVPNNVTVAGVPAKVIGVAGCPEPARSMDQMFHDDPNVSEL